MQTIHIKTTPFKAALLRNLAYLIGATITVDKPGNASLAQLIEKGEKDFAEGRGVVLTQDELRAMIHEVA